MSKIKVVKEKTPKQVKVKKQRKNMPKYVLIAVIAVIVAALCLMWALPNLPRKPQTLPNASYKGIIELWNVETFEGGSGSRQSWLTSKSAKFEKQNTGLYVHVTNLTVDELKQKLADNQQFDIICFGRGVGDVVKDYLAPLEVSTRDLRENMLLAGQFDGKQYALPLYAGAYGLFARTSQLAQDELLNKALTQTYTRKVGKNTIELSPMICGFTPSNSPLTALALSGGKGSAASIAEDVTQYQAYEQFVSNKTAVTLLGTQRDLYRLNQREQNGKIESLGFVPLSGYTDLVQFVGVNANCGEKLSSCQAYLQYLISDEVQQSLVNLSLFCAYDKSIYTDERYVALEQGLSAAFVPNAFADSSVIANQRQTAKATLGI